MSYTVTCDEELCCVLTLNYIANLYRILADLDVVLVLKGSNGELFRCCYLFALVA